ncbi:MAG: hypothetical protein AAB131_10335, partial [Actinomycetota bacterium]
MNGDTATGVPVLGLLQGSYDWIGLVYDFLSTINGADGEHERVGEVELEDTPAVDVRLPTVEVCNGFDDDGDRLVDEGFDRDADGVADCFDNCAERANPDQTDSNGDGLGDACDRPFANAGPDQTVRADATCGADVQLDGSRSFDQNRDPLTYRWLEGGVVIATGVRPVVRLGLGAHTIVLLVNDGTVDSDPDEVVIHVLDVGAPVIRSVTATPECLSPPNHGLVAYQLGDGLVVDAVDSCGTPAVSILSVVSSEPDDALGEGDGHTLGDVRFGATGFCVRSERAGGGRGRVYTVTVQATDASGNASTETTVVSV